MKVLAMLLMLVVLSGGTQEIIPHEKNRFYQGVATDGTYIYASTDQDVGFTNDGNGNITWDNNNIISVYDMSGNFVREKKDVYTELSKLGHFMSFGDIQHIDGKVYGTVYDRTAPYESRVLQFNKETLDLEKVYPVGDDLAEGLDKRDGHFWLIYHTVGVIRQFDEDFKFVKEYPLKAPEVNSGEGFYQGIFWDGDEVYMNLHGANLDGQFYAPGLDHFKFDGETFTFIERIKPPTYGSGQGIEKYGDKILWADRPANKIISSPRS